MTLISTVTSAAASLAAGPDPAASGSTPAAAKATSTKATVAKATIAKTTTAKATTAKTTTAKATTAKTTTAKTTTASGYSKTGDDFAFLKDPLLSVEEKLFRFMCAIAKRNDDEVVKKMEEMKGGAAKTAAASSTTGSATTKKSTGTSVWSALKTLVPPLGMAAQLVGDAKLKSMISQVSGPVLAAAATALGMPALAPLATKEGPALTAALLNGTIGGGEVATSTPDNSSGGSSSSSAAATSGTGQNEQVQMMELQRLVDKQKEMFSMISNILRAQHDTRMSIIGNVR